MRNSEYDLRVLAAERVTRSFQIWCEAAKHAVTLGIDCSHTAIRRGCAQVLQQGVCSLVQACKPAGPQDWLTAQICPCRAMAPLPALKWAPHNPIRQHQRSRLQAVWRCAHADPA
jgi:hypothetical protein